MIKITTNNNEALEIDVLKFLMRGFQRKLVSDNKVEVLKSKTKIGSVEKKDNTIVVRGRDLEKRAKSCLNLLEKANTIIASEKKINLFNDDFNIINKKTQVLFSKGLSSVGIKKLELNKNLDKKEDTIFNEPTLVLTEHISDDLKTGTSINLKPLSEKFDFLDTFPENMKLIHTLVDEKTTLLKVKKLTIGKYYKDRNLILIPLNLFEYVKFHSFEIKVPPFVEELLNTLRSSKINKTSVLDIRRKLFVTAFTEKARNKLKENEETIKSLQRSINEKNKEIRISFEDILDKQAENEFIQKNLDNKGEQMFEELEKTKKLPFVEKVDLDGETIKMKFSPTHITSNVFNRGEKRFPKRTMWVGSITFEISPSSFKAFNDNKMLRGNSHPHGAGDGESVCMGDGAGKEKIYELLYAGRFSELAKMLWFWIKTYRDSGAYVHTAAWYDDRLEQGFPVWDEKGRRIKINDPARIKSGEQIELEPADDYEKNIKKFKDVKL